MILLEEIERTNLQITVGKLPLTIIIPASLGLIQALRIPLENIRGGVLPSLPVRIEIN
jgi:hypothetical protein